MAEINFWKPFTSSTRSKKRTTNTMKKEPYTPPKNIELSPWKTSLGYGKDKETGTESEEQYYKEAYYDEDVADAENKNKSLKRR